MSHIVTCKVEMKNAEVLRQTITTLGFELVDDGVVKSHSLYSGAKATGVGFKLPGWRYPVVVDSNSGLAKFDNYNGDWGKQIELDKVVQRYSLDVAREEALVQGFNCEEEVLENGDVDLVMTSLETS